MYTQCPNCQTTYEVTAALLAQRQGSVTCSHCGTTFDALRSLTARLPMDDESSSADETVAKQPEQTAVRAQAIAYDTPSEETVAPDQAAQSSTTPTPKFAQAVRVVRNGPSWLWSAGIALLAPVLLVQIAYADREELLRSELARPWLANACNLFGCHLPLSHETEGLVLLSRDVSPHPSAPNALIISATLRNATDNTQAFPTVEITLLDLDEHRIAMRRFAPPDYVSDARTIAAGLAPNASSALVFEVADPGKNAVAYEFKFL